jgi:hypothetical protein
MLGFNSHARVDVRCTKNSREKNISKVTRTVGRFRERKNGQRIVTGKGFKRETRRIGKSRW